MLDVAAQGYASHHVKDMVAVLTYIDGQKAIVMGRGEARVTLTKDQALNHGLGGLARLAIASAEQLGSDAVDTARLINLASTALHWMPDAPPAAGARA